MVDNFKGIMAGCVEPGMEPNKWNNQPEKIRAISPAACLRSFARDFQIATSH
jgi:hypothetical protein